MMKSLKYLVLSDVHLGHRKTKAKFIIDNLYTYFGGFSKNSRFAKLDMIIVAGDLFDRLLDHTSKEYLEIVIFISKLFKFCADNQIVLRFLEGTPSHDWKQYMAMQPMAELVEQGLNFRYVTELEVEQIDDLGVNILYVPDEWRSSAAQTLEEAKAILKSKALDKADLAIMHGMFHYQVEGIPLKDSIKAAVHDLEEYSKIVDRWVNIGHVHTHSFFERAVAQGSFDRISHGEEGPKGAVLMEIYPDKTLDRFTFIENPGAKIYKSITVDKLSVEDAMAKFDKETVDLPVDSHVRIIAGKGHPMVAGLKELSIARPRFNITCKTLEEMEEEGQLIQSKTVIDTSYSPISITRENITGLITDGILSRIHLDQSKINQLNTLLEECHVR